MQIVGKDSEGHLIGVQHGLTKTTVYKSRERIGAGLHGMDDLGLDWNQIFQGINSNPIIQGIGAKIAGRGQGIVPIGQQPVYASKPGSGSSIDPTMLMLLGGGALMLVLLMRR